MPRNPARRHISSSRILITIPEAAEALSISEHLARELIRAGILPCVKISPNITRVPVAALNEIAETAINVGTHVVSGERVSDLIARRKKGPFPYRNKNAKPDQ